MRFSEKKKLLIVDDSAFMRKLISDFFANHGAIDVVATARDGKDAMKKIQDLKPDVVTMDVEMPEMNGLEALKKIMNENPVPIIMLSSTTKQGADNTVKAMEYGAFDFVAKPSGNISLDLHKVKDELISKVEEASKTSAIKLRNTNNPIQSKIIQSATKTNSLEKTIGIRKVNERIGKMVNGQWSKVSKKVILIGTSTGGPRALQKVVTKIPKDVGAPILIVQHMPAGFTKSLAERLNQLSEIQVKEAEHGDLLQNGVAYIAPGGYHLKIRKVGMAYSIVLDNTEPPRVGHRPSVDVMFEDVSQYRDFDKIAVIMTGMGYDGSNGLKALKHTGNVIAIAESANTCIVYGMPKAAVETNLVDEVAGVEEIAQVIMKYMH